MKNVIINKLEKYVFTEAQLKGAWKRLNKSDGDQEPSNDQLMVIAKQLLNDASHSELAEYAATSPWHNKGDITGGFIADDDSDPSMHIELIDTDQKDTQPSGIFVDRMLQLSCDACHLDFYIEDFSMDLSKLTCPIDGSPVHVNERQISSVKSKPKNNN